MRTRIVGAEVWKEDLQLTRPYRIAGEEITYAENAFIILRDSEGRSGIGSACPMPEICGESMGDTFPALHDAAALLHHMDMADFHPLLDIAAGELTTTPAARAAVDMALYDLYCKQLAIPLVDLFGRQIHEMETSVTIGITTEEQAHEDLMAHLRQGFHVIKVKIGDQVEHDISIVRKLREWGGHQFRLRVDANEGYDIDSLNRFLAQMDDLDIELIEQPFLSPASAQMSLLGSDLRRICMADEDLVSEEDATQLSRDQSYGVWNIKLMKSGGITPSRRIASLAMRTGIDVMWGCNDESRVSIAAALHAAFSCPSTKYLDLDGSFDIAYDVVSGGFIVENGKLRLTDEPGLGVTLL